MSVRLSIEVLCDDDDLTVDEATDLFDTMLRDSALNNPSLRKVHIF